MFGVTMEAMSFADSVGHDPVLHAPVRAQGYPRDLALMHGVMKADQIST